MTSLTWPSLLAFAMTSFLLDITPGPAVMQVIGHSVSNGWRPAQASILGILSANAMYCALAVFGLGTLILAVPTVFAVIKWTGVIYLGWLGLRTLKGTFHHSPMVPLQDTRGQSWILYRQSFLLQGANPKSVLFFCALLPGFSGEAEGAPGRIALLGSLAILLEYPVLLAYALLGARARTWLSGPPGRRFLSAISGLALLGAATRVAVASMDQR